VKYGFVFPGGGARLAVDFACEAEQAGWGSERSMARALRYDGILPTTIDGAGKHVPVTPEDVRGIAEYAAARREPESPALDIIVEGVIEGTDPSVISEKVRPRARRPCSPGCAWGRRRCRSFLGLICPGRAGTYQSQISIVK